ncbi:hypothetical protein [Lentibacillus saliphilus]|uniref:hypothetical protein n=1 Tax=Lentibacillus saliphilus TaxID=2737028 RepID=UPI001C301342|nr:hypothetical protein [Lentibacillus saliphilus]
MSNTLMVINRTEDWFIPDDAHLDPFYLGILLMEKLSTRQKAGLKYNRLNLIITLTEKKNMKVIETLDKAILMLFSRSLILIEESNKKGTAKLFISDQGLKVLEQYRKEIQNAY